MSDVRIAMKKTAACTTPMVQVRDQTLKLLERKTVADLVG
jgi:hypothetical protein